MNRAEILAALRRLREQDPAEYRRVVGEAVIQVQVKLRQEGEAFETEWGGDMYRQ